ncbi:MAG: hypothetical protein ACRYG8_08045, partial [Janthinobacterium lividum]
ALAMTNDLGPADDDADDLALEEDDEFTELLRACLVALRLPSRSEIYQLQRSPFWSVSDARRRISQMLPTLPTGATLEQFVPATPGQGLAGRSAAALPSPRPWSPGSSWPVAARLPWSRKRSGCHLLWRNSPAKAGRCDYG